MKRYANIAHILGLSNYNKVMSVRSLVNWIQFMLKEMNIPLTIQEIGTITPDAYFAAIDKRRYYKNLYKAVVLLKGKADII